ncbi:MAG: putative DNA modification/repair radical SAM protein [Eubacteriales bacterium]|nr:putative DNA modification/repair radical SAM protein [Eubacteriales bacterium]
MEVIHSYTLQEKLQILADGAKYDVACTSSGVDRNGKKGELGNSRACGICHSFSSDGRCISLLKVLMTNHCIYDCKYCVNRVKNDIPRAAFTPQELCELTMEFYRRNYIEGLFLSSGIYKNPTYTMMLMVTTLKMLREEYHFRGYIHVKAVPGAPDDVLNLAGHYADRMSINLELPTEESMKKIAPNKSFSTILRPMDQMTRNIQDHRAWLGQNPLFERSYGNRYLPNNIFSKGAKKIGLQEILGISDQSKGQKKEELLSYQAKASSVHSSDFPKAGLSSQMIIGASDETDYHLIRTSQFLYQNYDLRRVFYSAYIPINDDPALPSKEMAPPLKREHRLYQADFLMRYYGFQAGELLTESNPFFHEVFDPKCDWAIRNMEQFPVEVQTAPYDLLLRVPGIGPKSAKRIVQSRKYGKLDFTHLKKMGVVLKRAHFFLLCNGKQMYHIPVEENFVRANMLSMDTKRIVEKGPSYRQLSLFDDFGIQREGVV